MKNLILNTLAKRASAGDLHHAYLVIGRDEDLPDTLRAAQKILLCATRTAQDDCSSCSAYEKGVHADAPIIEVQERENISVQMVHGLRGAVATRPQLSSKTVAIIPRAHQMTPSASNALLKSLEEPPEDTIFLLGAPNERLLLLTLASRMHILRAPHYMAPIEDVEWADFLTASAGQRYVLAQKWFPSKMEHQDFKNKLNHGMVSMQYKLRNLLQMTEDCNRRSQTAAQIQSLVTLQEQLRRNTNKKMILDALITNL